MPTTVTKTFAFVWPGECRQCEASLVGNIQLAHTVNGNVADYV